MYKFPIGVITDSFKRPTLEAIDEAAKLGAKGVQMYATSGENSPWEITSDRKKELMNR